MFQRGARDHDRATRIGTLSDSKSSVIMSNPSHKNHIADELDRLRSQDEIDICNYESISRSFLKIYVQSELEKNTFLAKSISY